MKQYHEHLQTILDHGTWKNGARSGMPRTLSLFGYQFKHDLNDGFPLLTTKKMYWKGVVGELLWFLTGDTNIKTLVDQDINIWNGDAYNWYKKIVDKYYKKYEEPPFDLLVDDPLTNSLILLTESEFINWIKNGIQPIYDDYKLGDCGYQYGKVWTNWQSIELNQINNVINSLKTDPLSRRHLVTAVDPLNDKNLALYWCHSLFQFNCRPHNNEYILDCQLYQRSADSFLGEPFNIASYALLTHIIAKICNMTPGIFIHSFGDSHLYENHIEAAKIQLSRDCKPLPNLEFSQRFYDLLNELNENHNLDVFFKSLKVEDFIITNYNPHPAIKVQLSTGN